MVYVEWSWKVVINCKSKKFCRSTFGFLEIFFVEFRNDSTLWTKITIFTIVSIIDIGQKFSSKSLSLVLNIGIIWNNFKNSEKLDFSDRKTRFFRQLLNNKINILDNFEIEIEMIHAIRAFKRCYWRIYFRWCEWYEIHTVGNRLFMCVYECRSYNTGREGRELVWYSAMVAK